MSDKVYTGALNSICNTLHHLQGYFAADSNAETLCPDLQRLVIMLPPTSKILVPISQLEDDRLTAAIKDTVRRLCNAVSGFAKLKEVVVGGSGVDIRSIKVGIVKEDKRSRISQRSFKKLMTYVVEGWRIESLEYEGYRINSPKALVLD